MSDYAGSESRRAWDELTEAERRAVRAHNKLSRMLRTMRLRARGAVSQAVKDGRLTRQPCEECGCEPAEGHHDDYGKPLDVRWLCRKHHMDRHKTHRIHDAEWLSVSDVAMMLSVSTKQVRKWIANGQFDEIVVFSTRVTRISVASYRRFVEKSRAA